MIKLGIATILMLASYQGFTAHVTGNGGHGIQCRSSYYMPMFLEQLDLFEARVIRKMSINLGDPSLDPIKKAHLAISRLERLSPKEAEQYHLWIDQFESETEFDTEPLPLIHDVGMIIIPRTCRLVQIALQVIPADSTESRYHIDQNWWEALNNDSKASLILHEIIYRYALTFGQMNSSHARRLNGLIQSNRLALYSTYDYAMLLRTFQFGFIEYAGNQYKNSLFNSNFWNNNTLKYATLAFTGHYTVNNEAITVAANTDVHFHRNGQLESGTVGNVTSKFQKITGEWVDVLPGSTFVLSSSGWLLNIDGKIVVF